MFDLGMHDGTVDQTTMRKDLAAVYAKAQELSATPDVPGTYWPARFRHMANSPQYAGLFHQYLWSQMYAAVFLNALRSSGFDPETGRRLRRLMEHGGALPEEQILAEFSGGQPIDEKAALLRSIGLAA